MLFIILGFAMQAHATNRQAHLFFSHFLKRENIEKSSGKFKKKAWLLTVFKEGNEIFRATIYAKKASQAGHLASKLFFRTHRDISKCYIRLDVERKRHIYRKEERSLRAAGRDAFFIKKDLIKENTQQGWFYPLDAFSIVEASPEKIRKFMKRKLSIPIKKEVHFYRVEVDSFLRLPEGEIVKIIRNSTLPKESLRKKELKNMVKEGLKWCLDKVEKDGGFAYDFHPYWQIEGNEKYNMIRHAGTTWAIMKAMVFLKDKTQIKIAEKPAKILLRLLKKVEGKDKNCKFLYIPWRKKTALGWNCTCSFGFL